MLLKIKLNKRKLVIIYFTTPKNANSAKVTIYNSGPKHSCDSSGHSGFISMNVPCNVGMCCTYLWHWLCKY